MVSRTSPWGASLSPGQVAGQRAVNPITPGSRTDRARKKADQAAKNGDQVPVKAGQNSLPDVDGRSAFARRKRALVGSFLSDLGGPEEVSTAERILADKAATLTLQLQGLEARMEEGDTTHTTLDLYGRGVGHLNRVLKTMGIKRRARDVTPTPGISKAVRDLWILEGKISPDEEESTDE